MILEEVTNLGDGLIAFDGRVPTTGDAEVRPYHDNVVIVLDQQPTETKSGIAMVHTRPAGVREHRTARVVASGPGYYTKLGALIANTVKAGDRVLVDALCGQNYAMDLTVPRHTKTSEFQELFGERGEFRIVREQEILAVLEDEAQAAE